MMGTLHYLLFGALLGLARTAAALTCYKGNHTTVTGEFPTSSATCEAKDKVEMCVEKRRTNWHTKPGYFELYFGCGKCGKFKSSIIDCHECKTDRCNLDYGTDLKPEVAKMNLCYTTLNTPSGPLPVPVFCPKNQNCSSGTNPGDPNHILTGCQSHCGSMSWKGCQYCDFDLCNLQSASKSSSASTPLPILMEKIELPEAPPTDAPRVAKAAVEKPVVQRTRPMSSASKSSSASTPLPILMEKIELPEAPPTDAPRVAKAASAANKETSGSDESQAKAKSRTESSSADPAAQPVVMATTFTAVAAACLLAVLVA